MDAVLALAAVLAGLALRLAIPLAVTAMVIALLRWLDAGWQAQGQAPAPAAPAGPPCWEVKRCPPERRANCAAYMNPSVPCWQLLRAPNGDLRLPCLDCQVFRSAPMPAGVVLSQAHSGARS